MNHYSAVEETEIMIFIGKCMKLETIKLNEDTLLLPNIGLAM